MYVQNNLTRRALPRYVVSLSALRGTGPGVRSSTLAPGRLRILPNGCLTEMSAQLNTFEARTLGEWRKWLAKHHDSESVVWLVFRKRHTGIPSLAYEDAICEALCFGWVDSLVKRLDEARYARKFTPRKPDSKWSAINRKRYAQLKASGRLMSAGVNRPPTERTYEKRKPRSTQVPDYIQAALRKSPGASTFFETLAPSYRRMYVGWIDSAKRTETKERRLKEAIGRLAAGQKLGLK
jgi:uncharacterized protein YdeI (YjbR/CyaY-like superfamily)